MKAIVLSLAAVAVPWFVMELRAAYAKRKQRLEQEQRGKRLE